MKRKLRVIRIVNRGEERYYVQIWRWLPFPHWSNSFHYPDGSADYNSSFVSLKNALNVLETRTNIIKKDKLKTKKEVMASVTV